MNEPLRETDTNAASREPTLLAHQDPQVCCDDEWEAAYLRFETPEEEIAKFKNRLIDLGARSWQADAEIVELFCGRGNGLRALEELGFKRIEGVDFSASLLTNYDGAANCHIADCRQLRFGEKTKDIVIVQGGLHHLPGLPDDLDRTLAEVHRTLRDSGLLMIVEPWLTPFLSFVHAVYSIRPIRKLWPKLDALATMNEHEATTYNAWLSKPDLILQLLDRYFEPVVLKTTWGKLRYLGRRRATSGH